MCHGQNPIGVPKGKKVYLSYINVMTHSEKKIFTKCIFFCFRLISKKKHFFLSVQPKKHIKMERKKETSENLLQ
jgi:hypothetical protein